MKPRLLILGASTRSAAQSAARAGWQPVCIDLFADVDLRAVAEMLFPVDYPASLPTDVATAAADAWMYTGALENEPGIVAKLESMLAARGVPLIGVPAASIGLLREKTSVDHIAAMCGFLRPARYECGPNVDPKLAAWCEHAAGQTIIKPSRSGGGLGIEWWKPCHANLFNSGFTVEEYLDGTAGSTLLRFRVADSLAGVSSAERHGLEVVGHARLLLDVAASCAPSPFLFCGAIVSREVERELSPRLQNAVRHLAPQLNAMLQRSQTGEPENRQIGRGVIGIDWIDHERGPYLLEINPRWTSTAELYEWQHRQRDLSSATPGWQAKPRDLVLESIPMGADHPHRKVEEAAVAKLVLYARFPVVMPELAELSTQRLWKDWPAIADITPAGTLIETGAPICTVFACAAAHESCVLQLANRAEVVRRVIELGQSS